MSDLLSRSKSSRIALNSRLHFEGDGGSWRCLVADGEERDVSTVIGFDALTVVSPFVVGTRGDTAGDTFSTSI